MKYLPLLFLFACAVEPESQADKEYRVQIEIERGEAYVYWARGCIATNGIIYTYDPSGRCRTRLIDGSRYCIPHRFDWDIHRNNRTICASRNSLSEAFQF